MKNDSGKIFFSATDLANHLACQHSTLLEIQRTHGLIQKEVRHDPTLDLLIELGNRHEQAYTDFLRESGKDLLELPEFGAENFQKAIQAMREGREVIAQAWLQNGQWRGRSDFLLKVDRPSNLGNWSYEVADTKLSQTTKTTAILQLCLYSEILAEIQGSVPEFIHVVKPSTDPSNPFDVDTHRLSEYMAYFRQAKRNFEQKVNQGPEQTSYPEPCNHCSICDWWIVCNQKRREDDHLSFVAGMSKSQRQEMAEHQIVTLEGFANAEKPHPGFPKRGAIDSYVKSQLQAKIQLKGRKSGQPEFEFNEVEKDRGFLRLPEPSEGDVFFDIEGNPRASINGLEYLLGYVTGE